YITIAFAAFCWVPVVVYLVLRGPYGMTVRRALGTFLAAVGAPAAALGALLGAVGLERAVTMWNDQMALLPWGLSRILGITTYLGIPQSLPEVIALAGAVLTVVGILLAGRRPRLRRTGAPAG